MNYIGELISLGVAALWTVSALAAEIASKRMGVYILNVWRMLLALLLSMLLMWVATGQPLPLNAGWQAWAWLLASGFVGYFLGDWCLFNSYLTIGSRFGQLFMTLAPAFTAFFAWTMIGQRLSWHALLAMAVTLGGIGVAVTDSRGTEDGNPLPRRGILFGLGAALGQGLGL
ncbi:MAG: DMT family transporter, partial [Bacteroidaceae bacterium]|nr:DMT family transporter [Bacteroidaceae bacterium]